MFGTLRVRRSQPAAGENVLRSNFAVLVRECCLRQQALPPTDAVAYHCISATAQWAGVQQIVTALRSAVKFC